MSVAIIINPVSGGVASSEVLRRIELAKSMIERLDEPGQVHVSQRRGHARELAADAAATGARLVMAWGGDGTVNEVASALAGGETALGIIPAGSGNGLARHLGVARQPGKAISQALAAVPRKIDVGELGGRVFASVAGIGFDAHIAGCFDRDVSGRRGLSTYARITVRELWGYEPAVYRIDERTNERVTGTARDRRALLITFANSAQFGNGARIAPAARVDDGRLDMVVFEEVSRFATVCGLPRLFNGTVGRLRGVSTEQITEATVEAAQPIAFHVDGEPVQGGRSLRAQVRAGALNVCVI
jgi:YegS/Rv2252/BmrU family lipid kinase